MMSHKSEQKEKRNHTDRAILKSVCWIADRILNVSHEEDGGTSGESGSLEGNR